MEVVAAIIQTVAKNAVYNMYPYAYSLIEMATVPIVVESKTIQVHPYEYNYIESHTKVYIYIHEWA